MSDSNEEKPEEKSKTLAEKINYSVVIGPIPLAQDGGPVPGYAADSTHSITAPLEEFICLRGPCKHYWEIASKADSGNAPGTFEALGLSDMKQIYRSCLVHPGVETTLSGDDMIVQCNRWDPMSPSEVDELHQRRDLYQIHRRDP